MSSLNPTPRSRRLLLILAALLVVYVVWGSTYLAIRFAVETLPPFLMAGSRFLLSGLILLVLAGGEARRAATWKQFRGAGISGCLMLVGGNGLVCWAEQYVPSGTAALLISTTPIWFALLDWLIFRGPRPGALVVLGIAVGTAGVYVLLGPTNAADGQQVPVGGAAALLAACAFWAFGSLYSRGAELPPSVFLSTAMQMLAASVLFLALASVAGEWSRLSLAQAALRSWLSLAYLITFGSILAFTCYGWLLRNASPALVSTYAYVNPLVAVVLGGVLGGEALTTGVMLGAAIIIASVMIITLASRKRQGKRAAEPAAASEIAATDA